MHLADIPFGTGEGRPFALVTQAIPKLAGDDMETQMGHGLPGSLAVGVHNIHTVVATVVNQMIAHHFYPCA